MTGELRARAHDLAGEWCAISRELEAKLGELAEMIRQDPELLAAMRRPVRREPRRVRPERELRARAGEGAGAGR